MYNGYKELTVWKDSIKLVVDIYEITKCFPASEKFGLTSQMRRSAISMPSNIAEGWSRNYDKVFIQFLNTTQGSAAELETQLLIAVELKFLKPEAIEEVMSLLIRIKKMIRSLTNKLKAKVNGQLHKDKEEGESHQFAH